MWEITEAIEALRGRSFMAEYAPDRERAKELILEWVPPGATVGVGGSVTVRDLGVLEELASRGCRVLDHWQEGLRPEEIAEIRRGQLLSDVFISGANALTLQGEVVLVDGVGNRVAATAFGPPQVIVVVGKNKLVKDLSAAWQRIREMAAPQNARRLGKKLPCTEGGLCKDCRSPQRICRLYLVVAFKPAQSDFRVLIVGEDLGY